MLPTPRATHRFAAVLALVIIAPGFTVYAIPAGGYVGPAAGLEAAASSAGTTGNTGQDGAQITDASGGFAKINASGESNGGNGGSGTIADGGSGGIGVSFSGNTNFLENFGTITGGNGGNGGSGFRVDGGRGAIGVSFSVDTNSLVNSGSITGGNGGNGGNTADIRGSRASGGSGGIGVSFSENTNFLENFGTITGGNGGNGGNDGSDGMGRRPTQVNGGRGAIGVSFTGNNNSLVNSGLITGGNGGRGGRGGFRSRTTATGGSGGTAASFTSNNNSLVNSGLITGGNGGSGTRADDGSGGTAASFTGNNNSLVNSGLITGGNGGRGGSGVKISGENNILTNSGTISGGFANNGIQRAEAVVFERKNNRLVIKNGAAFEGKVNASGSNGDTLAFGGNENQSFDSSTIADTTPAGEQFEGFESVEINSGGKVTLTGTSAYTQDTLITRGQLDVAGDLSSTTIKLGADGTLKGIGTTGTVIFAPGGVHAPGNSIGSQTINGNYTLANGILEIEVTPGVASDEVVVNGTVDLNQGNLRILGLDEVSTGAETASHIIIFNDGNDVVVGVFNSVDNQLAFYEVEVSYDGGDGNDVVLKLERNMVALSEVAITSNQIAVAGVFDTQTGTADFQTVLSAVIAGTEDDARGALDMLAGDIHAAAPHVHRILHERTWTTLSNRLSRKGAPGAPLSSLLTGTEVPVGAYVPNGKAPVIDDDAPRVWVEAIAGYGNLDASGRIGSAETEFEWGGGIVGYEVGGSGPLTLGAYFQFAEISIDQTQRLAGINSTQAATGIYAGFQLPDDWKLAAHFGGSWLDNDSQRRLLFGGLDRTATGDYEDFHLAATLEIAKTFYVGETGYLEPFASITGRRERDGAFTETGAGAANLLRGSDTDYFANSILGVRFGGEWETENGAWNLRPRAQIGWQHRYGSVDNNFQTQFQGAPVGFTSSGTDTARNSLVGTVGMECFSLANGMSLYVDYGFGLSSKHDEHTFGAGVSIPW